MKLIDTIYAEFEIDRITEIIAFYQKEEVFETKTMMKHPRNLSARLCKRIPPDGIPSCRGGGAHPVP